MKRLLSLVLTVVACMCMLMMLTGCSEPENDYSGWSGNWQESVVFDEKGLFTESQQNALDREVQQKAQELEMNILIYIGGKYRSDSETKPFCDSEYEKWFNNGHGEDTDGLIYYLDLSGKKPAYDYISTSGKCILMYEDNRERIFNHMDLYLPASGQTIDPDKIYKAVEEFLSQLTLYATSGSHPSYYHDKVKDTYIYYKGNKLFITTKKPLVLWIRIWIISGLIGLITALITYLASRGKYTFKAKTNPSIYLSSDAVNFSQKSDTHKRTYQTRSRISSSSGGYHGGGGGRSGGSHHSGGSHGGGGHHR